MAHSHTYGLADILREAPSLLAVLAPGDQAALACCCKQLRDMIHSSVTAVTASPRSDARAVLRGTWPQLALIQMQPGFTAHVHNLYINQHSKLQLVASLWSMQGVQTSTAYIVSPLSEANPLKSIAVAFRHLQGSHWRQANRLSLTVHSQSVAVVAQMAQSDWPCLRSLHVINCKLGYACMSQLAKGSWPKLDSMDLSSNQLDEAAISALNQGSWPLLAKLTLDSNSSLGAASIALISKAGIWRSLSKLSLKHIKLDSSCADSIAMLHNQLEELDLACTHITARALAQLTARPWPHLQNLGLMGNMMTADAIASLVLADIPSLVDLSLAYNELNTAAAKHLSTSNWCKLRKLCLSDNALDDTAMAFLAKGDWPNLSVLALNGNATGLLGLEQLMMGQWLQLQTLILDSKFVSEGSWASLNLPAPLPVFKNVFGNFDALRPSLRDDTFSHWPNLKAIKFRPGLKAQQPCSAKLTNTQVSIKAKNWWTPCWNALRCGCLHVGHQ